MPPPNLNPLNNGSCWGPMNETPEEILFEKSFFAGCWISGVTCGMQFIIYLLCVYVLLEPSSGFTSNRPQLQQSSSRSKSTNLRHRGLISRLRSLSPSTLFHLTYSTILCIVNVIYTGSSYVALQFKYISDRNFPGGPFGSLIVEAHLPNSVMSLTMIVLSSVLSDALLLWRCRLIWRRFTGWKTELVMLFPLLMLLASLAMGMLWIFTIIIPSDIYSIAITHAGLAYFTLSLSTNILLTSLIGLRIYVHQLRLREAIGRGHGYDGQYTGVVAMFVESSVMSCMGSLLLLVTTALKSDITQVGIGFAPAFQIISTYLIILRVGQGRAWPKTTIHQGPGTIGATSTTANRGVVNITGTNATRMGVSQFGCGDTTGIESGIGIDGEEIYALDEGRMKITNDQKV